MITLTDIRKTYRNGALSVPVLNGVSLSIEQGEFVAVMGPSGSGKSTLMNIIGCLDRFDSGLLNIGQHQIEGVGDCQNPGLSNASGTTTSGTTTSGTTDKTLAHIRNRTIGFVFQGFNLIPRMSSLRNVELPMMYLGIKKDERLKRAQALLSQVGLGGRTEHRPAQLSGGQQQRVAIARALANNPSILIADEPTGSLDSVTSDEILNLFADLHRRNMTILMVTHEQPVAAHAQRIIRLRDGRIVP